MVAGVVVLLVILAIMWAAWVVPNQEIARLERIRNFHEGPISEESVAAEPWGKVAAARYYRRRSIYEIKADSDRRLEELEKHIKKVAKEYRDKIEHELLLSETNSYLR